MSESMASARSLSGSLEGVDAPADGWDLDDFGFDCEIEATDAEPGPAAPHGGGLPPRAPGGSTHPQEWGSGDSVQGNMGGGVAFQSGEAQAGGGASQTLPQEQSFGLGGDGVLGGAPVVGPGKVQEEGGVEEDVANNWHEGGLGVGGKSTARGTDSLDGRKGSRAEGAKGVLSPTAAPDQIQAGGAGGGGNLVLAPGSEILAGCHESEHSGDKNKCESGPVSALPLELSVASVQGKPPGTGLMLQAGAEQANPDGVAFAEPQEMKSLSSLFGGGQDEDTSFFDSFHQEPVPSTAKQPLQEGSQALGYGGNGQLDGSTDESAAYFEQPTTADMGGQGTLTQNITSATAQDWNSSRMPVVQAQHMYQPSAYNTPLRMEQQQAVCSGGVPAQSSHGSYQKVSLRHPAVDTRMGQGLPHGTLHARPVDDGTSFFDQPDEYPQGQHGTSSMQPQSLGADSSPSNSWAQAQPSLRSRDAYAGYTARPVDDGSSFFDTFAEDGTVDGMTQDSAVPSRGDATQASAVPSHSDKGRSLLTGGMPQSDSDQATFPAAAVNSEGAGRVSTVKGLHATQHAVSTGPGQPCSPLDPYANQNTNLGGYDTSQYEHAQQAQDYGISGYVQYSQSGYQGQGSSAMGLQQMGAPTTSPYVQTSQGCEAQPTNAYFTSTMDMSHPQVSQGYQAQSTNVYGASAMDTNQSQTSQSYQVETTNANGALTTSVSLPQVSQGYQAQSTNIHGAPATGASQPSLFVPTLATSTSAQAGATAAMEVAHEWRHTSSAGPYGAQEQFAPVGGYPSGLDSASRAMGAHGMATRDWYGRQGGEGGLGAGGQWQQDGGLGVSSPSQGAQQAGIPGLMVPGMPPNQIEAYAADGASYFEGMAQSTSDMAYQSNALAGNIQGSLSGTATSDWPRWKDGRPPCPLICFGYGGRVAMMTPKAITTGAQPTYAGAIELHSLSHIPSLLSDRQRVAGFAVPAGQVDPDRAAVERFPSALSPGAGKDRLARFVSDRMDLCMEEEPHCKRPDLLRTIWGVLRVLVKNQGTLISEPTAKSSSDPEKELVELLVPEAEKGSWVGGMGSSGLLLPGPDDYRLQAVAAEVQQLLVTGKRRQALRVATEGHLWSVAVVLAHGIGPGAVSETVTAMATSSLHAGSPLRTLMLMMGGSPDALEHAGPNKGKAVVNSSASQEASQVGLMGVGAPPGLATFTPSSDPFLGDWRSNLLVLATNKVKGSREAIAKLGDRLWDEWREVESAQLCYLVAGILPQPLDAASGCRLTLVGADHRSDPRLYASVEAIQRTEVYEWAFSVAHPHHRMVDFQPYKLVYAMMLAEYGKVAEAMSYCDSVLECLRSLGKLPQSMMVCHSVARELRDRLEKHAQAFNISVYKGGSLFSSIGRALDKGIHKLIGLGDSNDQTSHEGVSKTSSLSGDAGRAPSESAAFRRAPSHASLEGSRSAQEGWFSRARGPASVPLPNNGAAAYGPVAPGTPPPPDRSSSTKNRQGGGSREDGGQASSTGRQAKGNDKGWFGMVTNMWGRPAGKAAQTAAPADEGKFYYDKENKRWVLEGEEAATPQSSVAPPPTSLNWGTPPQPGTQSPSPHPSAGLPSAGRAHARDRSLTSRYVDTFGSSASGPTAPSPMLTPPMAKLPKTPNLLLPGGGSASMPNLVGMQAQSQTSGASQVVATNEKGVKRGLLSPGQGSNGLGSNGLGGEGQGHAQAPCTYSSLIENAGNVGAKRNGPCSQGSGVGMDTGLDLLVNQSPPVRWSCAGERAGPGTAPGPLASEEFREIEL